MRTRRRRLSVPEGEVPLADPSMEDLHRWVGERARQLAGDDASFATAERALLIALQEMQQALAERRLRPKD